LLDTSVAVSIPYITQCIELEEKDRDAIITRFRDLAFKIVDLLKQHIEKSNLSGCCTYELYRLVELLKATLQQIDELRSDRCIWVNHVKYKLLSIEAKIMEIGEMIKRCCYE